MIDNRIEVVFSFDTTGSMYPCLTQVRRKVGETVKRLMKEIPGIRIGIIAHGDYCDAGSTYVTKALDLTDDGDAIVRFVEKVGPTGGGDAPECYELVLHEARSLSWTKDYTKVFVLIGDDVPQPGRRRGLHPAPAAHPQRPQAEDADLPCVPVAQAVEAQDLAEHRIARGVPALVRVTGRLGRRGQEGRENPFLPQEFDELRVPDPIAVLLFEPVFAVALEVVDGCGEDLARALVELGEVRGVRVEKRRHGRQSTSL